MTVKQAIAALGGVPKSELEKAIKEISLPESEPSCAELELLADRFLGGDSFPPDAVLVNAEYSEVKLNQIKGAYGEVDIAGKPQSHLTTVDVFRRENGVCGWRKMPGAKVVVVD